MPDATPEELHNVFHVNYNSCESYSWDTAAHRSLLNISPSFIPNPLLCQRYVCRTPHAIVRTSVRYVRRYVKIQCETLLCDPALISRMSSVRRYSPSYRLQMLIYFFKSGIARRRTRRLFFLCLQASGINSVFRLCHLKLLGLHSLEPIGVFK